MVEGVVKSGLVRGMFPDPEPATEPTVEERARDIWANIFHKPAANANHNFGHVPLPPLMLLGQHMNAGPGLHHDMLLPADEDIPPPPLHPHAYAHRNDGGGRGDPDLTGMYDAEDDVWRCVDCTHEVWAGICSSCRRVYPENEEYDPDDELEEEDEYEEDMPFQMLNAIFGGAGQGGPGAGHGHGHGLGHGAHGHPDDHIHEFGLHDHDDEDIDDGDEDDFGSVHRDHGDDDRDRDNFDDLIDEFEAEDRAEFDRDYRHQLHRQLPYIHDLFDVGEVDPDEDEDDGEGEGEEGSDGGYESSFIDDGDARPNHGGGGERERGVIEISSDEDEDEEVREVRPRLGRRNAPIVVSDDEEEAPPRPSASRRRIVDLDEDE